MPKLYSFYEPWQNEHFENEEEGVAGRRNEIFKQSQAEQFILPWKTLIIKADLNSTDCSFNRGAE